MTKSFKYEVSDSVEVDVTYSPHGGEVVITAIRYKDIDVKEFVFEVMPFEASAIEEMAITHHLQSEDFFESID